MNARCLRASEASDAVKVDVWIVADWDCVCDVEDVEDEKTEGTLGV